MKILIVSPLGYAVNHNMRYGGIERLAYEFTKELVKSHQVAVMGRADSIYPEGVAIFPTSVSPADEIFQQAELKQYQTYQSDLTKFDVIHDFSHQHLVARFNGSLPTANVFWHAPSVAQFPKAPYNIVALSKWAAREYEKYYHQKAIYQNTIVIDTDVFKLSNRHRNDRWLSLGAITPRKGHLEAIKICRECNVPLDVVGKEDANEAEYARIIKSLCDGKVIRFLGEVTDEEKIRLYQDNKAMIYDSQEPEVSNHKLQEAMLCGMPVVVNDIGAMNEIVTNGVDGYLCHSWDELKTAVNQVSKLNPKLTNQTLVKTYSIANVVADYVKLYEKVANGLRW